MSEQLTYSILSSSFGFVAATSFCVGSAFLNKNKIIELATTYWGHNEEQAKAAISQSIQYGIGALLLLSSFCFQVAAILGSPTKVLIVHPILSQPLIFVLVLVFSIGGLALCCFYALKRLWQPPILEALKQ